MWQKQDSGPAACHGFLLQKQDSQAVLL